LIQSGKHIKVISTPHVKFINASKLHVGENLQVKKWYEDKITRVIEQQ
jgi:hypothetical protein